MLLEKKTTNKLQVDPLKSELFTKQACRDAVVVYSLFFLQQNIYIYMCISI